MVRLPKDVRKIRDIVLSVERVADRSHFFRASKKMHPKFSRSCYGFRIHNRLKRPIDKHIEKIASGASRVFTNSGCPSRCVQVGAVFLQGVPLRLSVAERVAANIIIHDRPQPLDPGIGQTDIQCLLFRGQPGGDRLGAAGFRQRRSEDQE